MRTFFGAALLGATLAAGLFLAPLSSADEFSLCPSGLTGVATEDTSCAFADNVRAAWMAKPGAAVAAFSPVTQQSVTMQCAPAVTDSWPSAQRCVGANSSGVGLIVFIATDTAGSGPGDQPAVVPVQPADSGPSVAVDTDSPYLPNLDGPNIGCTWVNGYTRSNGTRVSGYFRC
ncbi:MAG: hypothetical protein QG671_1861 [Actinomycetota bacterium]|nr:hypothetical protein [Actinomycetota bacterium]